MSQKRGFCQIVQIGGEFLTAKKKRFFSHELHEWPRMRKIFLFLKNAAGDLPLYSKDNTFLAKCKFWGKNIFEPPRRHDAKIKRDVVYEEDGGPRPIPYNFFD
ncbi:MAG: hypothetical protein WC975_04840 [Phycisphaerae bacterium]